jgi:hypothetical protein
MESHPSPIGLVFWGDGPFPELGVLNELLGSRQPQFVGPQPTPPGLGVSHWDQPEERQVFGPDILLEAEENIRMVRENLKATQSRQ